MSNVPLSWLKMKKRTHEIEISFTFNLFDKTLFLFFLSIVQFRVEGRRAFQFAARNYELRITDGAIGVNQCRNSMDFFRQFLRVKRSVDGHLVFFLFVARKLVLVCHILPLFLCLWL
jgi:hypothetical protein